MRRGLFPNAEMAVAEITRHYVLRQIERYRAMETAFQARYGMTYEQFDDYLRTRSGILSKKPNPALNQAIMLEEDDALDWKIRATWYKIGWACIQRKDNKKHFPEIASHPHHFHSSVGEVEISPLTSDPEHDLSLVMSLLFPPS